MELNGTIFVQIFVFVSLLIWLSRTLFAPIMRLFDERERRIEGAKKTAAELAALADEKAKLFAVEYERARLAARQTLNEEKQIMDRNFADALDKVKATAREKLLAADVELVQQEKIIREQLMSKTEVIASDMIKVMVRSTAH